MSTELDKIIEKQLETPHSVSVDGMSITNRSVSEIERLVALQRQAKRRNAFSAIQVAKPIGNSAV